MPNVLTVENSSCYGAREESKSWDSMIPTERATRNSLNIDPAIRAPHPLLFICNIHQQYILLLPLALMQLLKLRASNARMPWNLTLSTEQSVAFGALRFHNFHLFVDQKRRAILEGTVEFLRS
nr:hypothetical protein Iba_chr06aCG5550 [Ipomoea batatas]